RPGHGGPGEPGARRAGAVTAGLPAYTLGGGAVEQDRLRGQADDLRPHSEALFAGLGVGPGWSALDLGCGPCGKLDLLADLACPARAAGWWAWTPAPSMCAWPGSSRPHGTWAPSPRSWATPARPAWPAPPSTWSARGCC